jgi:hypothetical protein
MLSFHQLLLLKCCVSLVSHASLFFIVSWGEVRLSTLDMSATNWPIEPAPDDKLVWSSRWNKNWQGKPKYSEETRHSATLSATNLT